MTRINIILPKELYDQHLLAEYREIFMIPAALSRTLKSKVGLDLGRYPKRYTLGRGHVVFFYNKGKYLSRRYSLLRNELKKRGFRLNEGRKFPDKIFKENNLFLDWQPQNNDFKIIRKRLKEKIKLKPKWYKKSPYQNWPKGKDR